jgi:hypothetical protein
MKYFMRYNPKLGFKFAVDAIHSLPNDAFHVALFCLNPPGALYREVVNSTEIQFTTKPDWNSAARTPVFLDGFSVYKNIDFDPNVAMIVDVRSVIFLRGKTELRPVGWTVLPVFTEDGYVNSGMYQLPLFKGGMPAGLPRDLAVNSPWEYVTALAG